MNQPVNLNATDMTTSPGKASAARTVAVITGPTASGKSALAVDLAERHSGVVINADSMQVYRGLDILTSAPDNVMRARAPHALFGIFNPDQPCSAGEWREIAMEEISKAHDAGLYPIVVGGTGLYLRSLMTGIARMPAIPDPIRTRIRSDLRIHGSTALYERLKKRDPASAARLSHHDGQRICRALEVLEATGQSLTDWQQKGAAPQDDERLEFRTVLLLPPRGELYAACDERFRQMLERGALDEVRALARLSLDPALPVMKALGVPPLLDHLKGNLTLDEARQQGQQATRRYVKRQLTWFRHQIIADIVVESQYNDRTCDLIFPEISEFVLT